MASRVDIHSASRRRPTRISVPFSLFWPRFRANATTLPGTPITTVRRTFLRAWTIVCSGL